MSAPPAPVVVVGGGVAGMAAAARLAKAGHPVELFERADVLGGRWAPGDLPGVGPVDAAPGLLPFPAPWRDLFRKSGRPLEAELARSGHALVPAPPVRYRFADGSLLDLPTERGAQQATLRAAYGAAAADRWRDLLDELDEVWQTLRPLGLEYPLQERRQLSRPVLARLHARRSLAWLAARLQEPHLEALVRSLAHRHGSRPERTPAFVAVDLSVSRRFGHWHVAASDPAARPSDTGRSSVLVEVLAARLATRRVVVHRGTPVTGLEVEDGRVVGVRVPDGLRRAAAVVVTTDPWQLVDALLPPDAAPALRRRTHRLHPAAAPAVEHGRLDRPARAVTETVELDVDGTPVVSWARPVGDGTVDGATVVSRHDFGRAGPNPSAGAAWRGWRSWLQRPPVTPGLPGLHLASAASAGGNGPSQVVLSGALASYACHDALG
ncbi:Phytoene dehydrogenase-related protein [Friedmanniella luteola]|uniref:Phytoene dehydrogenase-related protein n=1 Tax=Friedmanniella luteola TaxID=546871 RepID=A0A1H1PAA3_9ACTN|nr:FAD-dependent oxidoreductase [Friedmanniella luteola]SDS07935.1 Phytoene dehydrogenase-related protein [Friedmanniella luteola]